MCFSTLRLLALVNISIFYVLYVRFSAPIAISYCFPCNFWLIQMDLFQITTFEVLKRVVVRRSNGTNIVSDLTPDLTRQLMKYGWSFFYSFEMYVNLQYWNRLFCPMLAHMPNKPFAILFHWNRINRAKRSQNQWIRSLQMCHICGDQLTSLSSMAVMSSMWMLMKMLKPTKLISKFLDLGDSTPLWHWTLDLLSTKSQSVRTEDKAISMELRVYPGSDNNQNTPF